MNPLVPSGAPRVSPPTILTTPPTNTFQPEIPTNVRPENSTGVTEPSPTAPRAVHHGVNEQIPRGLVQRFQLEGERRARLEQEYQAALANAERIRRDIQGPAASRAPVEAAVPATAPAAGSDDRAARRHRAVLDRMATSATSGTRTQTGGNATVEAGQAGQASGANAGAAAPERNARLGVNTQTHIGVNAYGDPLVAQFHPLPDGDVNFPRYIASLLNSNPNALNNVRPQQAVQHQQQPEIPDRAGNYFANGHANGVVNGGGKFLLQALQDADTNLFI